MATKALKARVGALESRFSPLAPDPRIFLKIRDSGIADPAVLDAPLHEYSDATIVGYRTGAGRVPAIVRRITGEAIDALEARAVATHPDNVVFFAMYDDEVLH